MRKIKVVTFGDDIADEIWPLLQEEEWGAFDDNGGDPDGPCWMQDAATFSRKTLALMRREGAQIVAGYEVDYMPTDSDPFYGQVYCGFSSANLAYTTSAVTARAIQRHYDLQVAAGQ